MTITQCGCHEILPVIDNLWWRCLQLVFWGKFEDTFRDQIMLELDIFGGKDGIERLKDLRY